MEKAKLIFEVNGHDFEKLARNGLANLSHHVEEVNQLNVFPVPDGDTGSNMFLTLKNAIESAKSDKDLGDYLRSLSTNMLLGARGNSGVILSQLFKGFAERLEGKDDADAGDLCSALVAAYKTAYASVKRPVEGTMLTVAREGIEKSRSQMKSDMPIDRMLSYYLAEMRRSLSYTPTLLPALKEAGVVDSGAMGYILIVEGMLKALYGELLSVNTPSHQPQAELSAIDTSSFNAESDFSFGYCMEFLLQLLSSRREVRSFDSDRFSDILSEYGDSIVVIQDGERVKVHVHTKTPAKVIEYAQRFGEFITFKLENMHLQHTQYVSANRKKHYELAVLAACNGEGMKTLYKEFDYCRVIDGGEMMNVSCQEFINGIDSVDADYIVILPNNKNSVSAANQAAKLSNRNNVCVLPSTNVVQGYLALSMDIASDTPEERTEAFRANTDETVTVCIARAVRSSMVNGEMCNAGDSLAFVNGRIAGFHSNAVRLIEKLVKESDIAQEVEYIQVFFGAEMLPEQKDRIAGQLSEALPDIEISCVESGHAVYDMILSLA